jgi:DNA-binding NarL/FixJ family response regulator
MANADMLAVTFGWKRRCKTVWRVFIVEDDPDMREFFESGVARSTHLCVAASAGTVAQALALLEEADPPDVLLTDLQLPDGSGLDIIREVRRRFPACESLVISMFGDEDNVLSAIEAGALGYIHKDAAPDDIAQTILDMKAGASPISPMVARRVLAKYVSLRSARSPVSHPAPAALAEDDRPALSRREQEVLELISRGFSYQEIARLQRVSVHTVQTHIKNLYGKLAVHSKVEAVFEATRMGLLPRNPR